jgi:hypothetical protein
MTATTTCLADEGDGWYIPFGAVMTFAPKSVQDNSLGLEVSAMRYTKKDKFLTWGGAFQFEQHTVKNDQHYQQVNLLGQVGWTIPGIEFGFSYMTAGNDRGATFALQTTPYLSFGIVYVGPRIQIPLFHGGEEGHPFRIALALGLKIPIPIGKPPPEIKMPNFSFPSGRPLTIQQKRRVASLVCGRNWLI